ncbi:MAG: hypothetical protein AAF725_22935 [Acidobacteriota bacterium]
MTDSRLEERLPVLEIVRLRCAGATRRRAEAALSALLAEPEVSNARLLRSAEADHELALLLWSEAGSTPGGGPSPLGLRLARELRSFGAVSYSVWMEIGATSAR